MSVPGQPTGRDERWVSDEATAAWQRTEAVRREALGAVTEAMLDLAGVGPGARVLDVAAGGGGQTLVAARSVGPTGSVVAVDISAAMLESAREAVQRAGLTNVVTHPVDVASLDLEPSSFDAAICRYALMLFPQVPQALAEIRRMLKPGGRFAALVFAAPERNPMFALPAGIIRRRGRLPLPGVGEPEEFALSGPGLLQGALEAAGFREVMVRAIPIAYECESLLDVMTFQRDLIYVGNLMAQLPAPDCDAAWREIEQAWGDFAGPAGFYIPGEALLGGGVN